MKVNPFAERLQALEQKLVEKKLDAAIVSNQAHVRSLTGVDCDNACLLVVPANGKTKGKIIFHTDFRYVPMVHRVAPYLKVGDIKKVKLDYAKVGFESSMTHAKYLKLKKDHPKSRLIDIADILCELRSVKTAEEIDCLRASEELNDLIWSKAQSQFKAGMTELDMARIIRKLMIDLGDGEAFETIVCVGRNAAECHHVPDDTVWNGREPILVDMGVKLNGYCSDMTRNIVPEKPTKLYRKVYDLVLQANMKAIAAAKPGMTTGELDAVARKFLKANGFGEEFGHSLGHGVGLEIHEAPAVARKQKTVLKPGMTITIEPGVYLEDNLGVRIEDLIVITEDGCTVLSHSAK